MSMTATQAQQLYVAYFNRPADTLGLAYWTGKPAAQASAAFSTSAEYVATYAGMSNAQIINAIYTNLFGRPADDLAGLTFWANHLTNGTMTVSNAVTSIAAAAKGTDLVAYNNKVTAATAFTNALDTAAEVIAYSGTAANVAAKTWLSGVTTDATLTAATTTAALNASVAGVVVAGAPVVVAPAPIALTTAVDTKNGGAGDDTFDARTVVDSWTTFDKLDGGAGTDTLNVATTATTAPVGGSVLNIENVNVSTTGAGYTIDATSFTNLKTISALASTQGAVSVTAASTVAATAAATGTGTVAIIGTGGSLAITAGTGAVTVGGTAVAAALTDVTTSGGGTVTITDRSGASAATGSTLKTVTVSKAADDVAITANGLTTLNLSEMVGADTVGDTTITAAAGTRALSVALNGMDSGGTGAASAGGFTVTDAEATSLAVTSATKASFDMTFAVAKATGVTVDAAIATQLDGITAGVATTLGLSGASNITIAAQTLAAAAVITSTGAGNRTLSTALGVDQQYVGTASSGVDTISLGVTTKAITTGAGNDVITSTGTVGTGGSVNAGDGIDTIIMTDAQAAAADNSSTFNSKFTNFETVQISDALGATTVLNMAGLNNASTVVLAAGGGHATTASVDNLASGGTITLLADTTGVTANVRDALFNAADTVNLVLTKTGGVLAGGTFTAPGAETVNITANDATTTAAGSAANLNTLTLVATSATSVNVAGNNGLNLTNTGNTKITTFNASGVVANGTAGADTVANLAVTFVSANNTATAAVSITGGAGSDRLAGNAANSDTINGGAASDIIIGDAQGEVQTFTVSTKADATGSGTLTVNGTVVAIAGNADADAAATATRIVTLVNGTAALADVVVASAVGAAVTLTYNVAVGNVATAALAAVGGNTIAATGGVTVGTEGAVNTKADILTGGAGSDFFHFGAGASNLVGNIDTITDLDLGTSSTTVDTLVFGNAGATKAVVTLTSAQQAVVTASATLAGAIDNALAAVTADGATALFTYGSDTYLVHNGDGNTTFTAAADYVVKVTGFVGTLDAGDFSVV